jgi:hypothetical protein
MICTCGQEYEGPHTLCRQCMGKLQEKQMALPLAQQVAGLIPEGIELSITNMGKLWVLEARRPGNSEEPGETFTLGHEELMGQLGTQLLTLGVGLVLKPFK